MQTKPINPAIPVILAIIAAGMWLNLGITIRTATLGYFVAAYTILADFTLAIVFTCLTAHFHKKYVLGKHDPLE